MKKGFKSGQALVEYGLIIVFVALAVIVVVSVLGPSVRDVFAQVVNDAGQPGAPQPPTATPVPLPTLTPTPTSDPGWTFCSLEYDFCSFNGTYEIRYGKDGTYVYKTISSTKGVWCINDEFTDPLYGIRKRCDIR